MKGNILVVDDEKNQGELLADFLLEQGHTVSVAVDGSDAITLFEQSNFELIITDLKMRNIDGVTLLKNVKAINPTVAVIIMSAFGTIEDAVEAMKAGADDFLVKPINLEQLNVYVNRAMEHFALRRENDALKQKLFEKFKFETIIGESGAMQESLNLAGRAAPSKAALLIRGESGTGKGLLANAIHIASKRNKNPFIEINCAALSPGVLESELFGHEKGAFTGAEKKHIGRFEMANGGTLFIDEVGDIPLETQVKLLNVLQSNQFVRVGGNAAIAVDVRIISATHRDLEKMMEEGLFREDLYFRLNVVTVHIPPLRKRKSDIPLLIDDIIKKYADQNEKKIQHVSAEAMTCLMKYDYPGNVRELENALQRAIVLTRSDTIELADLPMTIQQCGKINIATPQFQFDSIPLPEFIENIETNALRQALQKTNGIQTQAAQLLGITERNLRYKIEKYGLK